MNLAAFQILRNGLKMNAAPATAQARRAFETGLREELLATGLFEDIEVGSSDDADRHVVALGTYRADVDDDATVLAIQLAWAGLAFHHWEAHAFLTADGHVELQAATLDRPGGRFVTVHLIAQRAAEMPEQRRHEEARILAYSA